MVYLIGGSPRSGKSILAQKFSATKRIGWISTDLLLEQLRIAHIEGVKREWDATPEAITAAAEWFFPYLERFTWGVSGMGKSYVIEGVDFLPAQVSQLAADYAVRPIFLGNSRMTLDMFDTFPGHSPGYACLPEDVRQRFANDVPAWSEFIRQQAEAYGYPYIDTGDDFSSCLREADAMLQNPGH